MLHRANMVIEFIRRNQLVSTTLNNCFSSDALRNAVFAHTSHEWCRECRRLSPDKTYNRNVFEEWCNDVVVPFMVNIFIDDPKFARLMGERYNVIIPDYFAMHDPQFALSFRNFFLSCWELDFEKAFVKIVLNQWEHAHPPTNIIGTLERRGNLGVKLFPSDDVKKYTTDQVVVVLKCM